MDFPMILMQNQVKIFFFLVQGSKVSYAEPQNLTERIREALLDRKPLPGTEDKTSEAKDVDSQVKKEKDSEKSETKASETSSSARKCEESAKDESIKQSN